jgi:hypothetical protein
VSQKATEIFHLKNSQPRSFAIFQVDQERLPPGLEIKPMKGKISPEENFRFEATFQSKIEIELKGKDVWLNLRGGKPIKINMHANTIIPQVHIIEDSFDFGGITFGNNGFQTMTVINESSIQAVLNLDLRVKENDPDSVGFACLEVDYKTGDDDSVVIEEKEPEEIVKGDWNKVDFNDDKMIDGDDSDMENESIKKLDGESSRFFKIKIKPQKKYKFTLKFSPMRPTIYSFYLPITLAGYGRVETLTRRVFCKGLTPKFLMDPLNGIREFKKKTITPMDTLLPECMYISLSNPDLRAPLNWHLDTNNLDIDKVFTIYPMEGILDAKQSIRLKTSFKPMFAGSYEVKLPLYLESENKPYSEIILKGEGAIPRILFDRREIVLPIVPLGIESKCTFRIINDGYQSLNLKAVISPELGPIPLTINYPEGNTLGINNAKIKVEVVFLAKKPLSFTTKLEFEDDNKKYPIFISGTADNCLLTNFPFFQRFGDDYKFVSEPGKHVSLTEIESENLSQGTPKGGKDSVNFSKANSIGSKSIKSQNVGFIPIPMEHLDKSCEKSKKWINDYILNAEVASFPKDIIEANGQQMYEVIEFLTKRIPPARPKIDNNMQKTERVDKLYDQYKTLLHFLKENGAMLNTIRPEYLLSHADINLWYRNNWNDYAANYANKISESKHKYVSMDAWTVLFYQILKIYYLCRVNTK